MNNVVLKNVCKVAGLGGNPSGWFLLYYINEPVVRMIIKVLVH